MIVNRVQCLLRRISLSEINNLPNNVECPQLLLHGNAKKLDVKRYLQPKIRSFDLTPQCAQIKKMSSGASKTNRLALEKSPYLLQHATNPIDWYPWGPEAFDRAKAENKIIFLSVGYSTCHWCHVMETESFESEEIAAIMNEHFVSIKVDREERPDVDRMYMNFIQASTGVGGWPMSLFLTPNLEPLAGGTYFPPDDNFGRPGFKTVLNNIVEQWQTRREAIMVTGERCLDVLKTINSEGEAKSTIKIIPVQEVWQKCLVQYSRSYDDDYGGFSHAPKFPQPSNFNFLFHLYSRQKNTEQGFKCLQMCLRTLDKMAMGGIHDHVNGGFARYSVDDHWHVPHFEKMLYDQAQLVVAYADAYVLTKNEFYADVVRDIVQYVTRDLRHPDGGFYGAEDADSYPHMGAVRKQEGAFCVWEYEEIANLLRSDSELFNHHYNVQPGGNVSERHDPHGELKNKNVLVCLGSYEDTGRKFGMAIDDVKTVLARCHAILYVERLKRPKPHVDTKIVTSWNGLMLSGLSKAGFVLKDQTYINQAIAAANFIKSNLYTEDEMLLRCCYGSGTNIEQTQNLIFGFLDDYAFVIRGLLDLYEASLDVNWLSWAESLQQQQDRLFWDDSNWGYFTSPSDDPNILIRGKEDQDGAEPCGNSVSVHNLIRLASYLDRADLKEKAGRTLTAFSERLKTIPIALPEMASALLFYHNSPTQVFIAGEKEDDNTKALLDVVRSHFIPGRILAVADGPGGCAGLLYQRHESMAKMKRVGGKSAAYVCRNFTCSMPVTEPEELATFFDSNATITEEQ